MCIYVCHKKLQLERHATIFVIILTHLSCVLWHKNIEWTVFSNDKDLLFDRLIITFITFVSIRNYYFFLWCASFLPFLDINTLPKRNADNIYHLHFFFRHRIDYYCCQTNTACFWVLFLPWKSVLIFPLLDSDLVFDLWRFWSYYKLIHFFNNFPSLIKMDTYWLFWNLLGYPINCGSLVSDSPMFYQFYIQWSILYSFFLFLL